MKTIQRLRTVPEIVGYIESEFAPSKLFEAELDELIAASIKARRIININSHTVEVTKPILAPTFFNQPMIEDMLGKKLTDAEYLSLIKRCADDLCDEVSELVIDWMETAMRAVSERQIAA